MGTKKFMKIAGLSSLLLVTGAADAGWKGNFLLGVEGGYAWRNGDLKVEQINGVAGAPPGQVATSLTNHSDAGGIFGILGGYQAKCNKLLLGLEANINWNGSGDSHNFHRVIPQVGGLAPTLHYSDGYEYDRGTVVGLSFRAGYQMTDWLMPYIRIGAETSKDDLSGSSAVSIQPAGPLTTEFTVDDDRSSFRFIGGAGVEVPVWAKLTLRAEYLYSSRGRGVEASALTAFNPVTGDTDMLYVSHKPDQHTAKAALVWNF